ncbi:NAD-dependent epimerase/dehydratase family protein [Saccharicrinis aurantiacus]|uniref:NAD-dependent epimerase/dehydratase family protein n=1 Tax=Saccharicrinis aurantiacus TaxID=1849719 RepID=UPI00249043EA|nr:NAD-dependent epimerase/dehydratase family protein [Saccharicrinis aurantiacus]
MKDRKIIIFGSAGFVGSHFISFINENNLGTVITYDIKDDPKQDVRLPITILGDFSSSDIIINLAAIHKTPGHPDFDYFETNIKGSKNVCSFASEKGIDNIIFTSSIAPYGASEENKTEDTLETPNTPYGISKLVAEKNHQIWQKEDLENRRLVILRPGVIFGTGEGGNFTRLYTAIEKGVFFYPGRRDTQKACIYVKDLVYASLQLIELGQTNSGIYNFCYPSAPRIDNIVHHISKVANLKEPKLKVSAKLMIVASQILGAMGGKKIGIHPDRVKKLMISTNISGEKLEKSGIKLPYGFENGLRDWFNDCGNKGMY